MNSIWSALILLAMLAIGFLVLRRGRGEGGAGSGPWAKIGELYT